MQKKEKVFTEGLIAKRNDKAPDYVICNLSVRVDEFKAFIDKHSKNGWVNLDVLRSKNGKIYSELSTFEAKKKDEPRECAQGYTPKAEENSTDQDVPF